MIWQSARMALNGTAAASRVQGVRVADIMDHEPVVVRGTSTVEQALDESFKLSNTGPIVGTIYQDRLTAIAGEIGRKLIFARRVTFIVCLGALQRDVDSQIILFSLCVLRLPN